MIGILLCMMFFGAVVGISYYFAYSDAERSRRPVARAAGAAARPPPPPPPPPQNNPFGDD